VTAPTTEQFIEAVTSMRASQKDYFRTREIDALRASKALEKRVDEMLAALTSGAAPPPTQADLFGGGGRR
jgi:hypothetical protein